MQVTAAGTATGYRGVALIISPVRGKCTSGPWSRMPTPAPTHRCLPLSMILWAGYRCHPHRYRECLPTAPEIL